MERSSPSYPPMQRIAFMAIVLCAAVATLVQAATISTITPNRGSLNGWTRVSILGTGFDIRGRSNLVFFGTGIAGVFCDPIPNECTTTRIVCVTPPYQGVGPMPVTVNSFGYNAICSVSGGCSFEYTIQRTPVVTAISPQWLIAPANITVYGSQFTQGDPTVAAFDFTMWIGDEERCNLVSTVLGSSFICNVINMRPGLLPTTVILGSSGMATMEPLVSRVAVLPSISAVKPAMGSLGGGQLVTIYGSSFSPDLSDNYVTIHGAPCIVNAYSESFITCRTTPHAATTSATRQLASTRSYQVDVYLDLPNGYDLDLYFIGTTQYLNPDRTEVITNSDFSFINGYGCDQCGFRVTAQFVPTFTGSHVFSIIGDDWFEAWLSETSDPVERKRGLSSTGSTRALDISGFNDRRIVYYAGCCRYVESSPQHLVAGRTYWLRMFVKNGYGGLRLGGFVVFNNTKLPIEDMMYHSTDYVSPVKVVVADMPAMPQASCYNFSSCDFNYDASLTPTVTDVSPKVIAPLSTLTVVGTGFDTTTEDPGTSACSTSLQCGGGGCACETEATCTLNAPTCTWSGSSCTYSGTPPQCYQWSLNVVTVGGRPCNVTSQTATTLTCTMPYVTAGHQRVAVSVGNHGAATGESQYVLVDTVVTGVTPVAGSVNGGNVITIAGYGFSPDAIRVTVGGLDCAVQSVAYFQVTCLVPALASEGAAAIHVYTKNDHRYVLPTAYQYDAKPVRPGTTVEVLTASLSPTSGPASGLTRVFIVLPTAYSMSSSSNITAVIGGTTCDIRVSGSNQIQCITRTAPRVGTFASYVSFVDKYEQGVSVALPTFTYYHAVTSISPSTLGTYGGTTFYFTLTSSFSPNEVSLLVAGVPCTGLSIRGTRGSCTTGAQPTGAQTRPVIQAFDFLGDGNPLTNPLNFVDASAGVTVDSSGNAFVPAGEYLMSKRQFTRPFSLRVNVKATLPMVQFNNIDRSIIIRACVSQPTLSSDGFRGIAGTSNASFLLYGGGNARSGTNTIMDGFATAAFDTTLFQEHRLEVWNTEVRYYVNNVLIYSMIDTSYKTGAVGIGFSAQGVTVRDFVVDSLYPELMQVNVSGTPVHVPSDVFYTTTGLPSASGISVSATTNEISLSNAQNVETSSQLMVVASENARVTAASVPICASFFTTAHPISGALTYKCQPNRGHGTYWVVLVNSLGAASAAMEIQINLLVLSVAPTSVPMQGGGRVTIYGSGFSSKLSVLLGSASALIANFNTTMIVADMPSRTTAGTATITVTDGAGTVVPTTLSYSTLTPLNVTSVSSPTAALWSTITVFGTGFTTGVRVYVGPNEVSVQSVTSTYVRVQISSVTADVFGNTTIRLVQPNVGIAFASIEMMPYVYNSAATPVSSLGGASISVPGTSFYNIDLGTPVASIASDFGTTGMVVGWSTNNPNGAPAIRTECRSGYYGPFEPETQLMRTYTGLPVHTYVRVTAKIAIGGNWWGTGVIVNGVLALTNSMQCDTFTGCPLPCVGEVLLILRHTGASLPVSIATVNARSFSLISVTVDVFSDLALTANVSGVTAPVDKIDASGATYTVPAGLPVGNHVVQLLMAGVDHCHYNWCQLNVQDAATITHATLVDLVSPNGAPQFVPMPGVMNVSYTASGTTLSDTSSNRMHYSTQRWYAGDATVLRVRATLVASVSDGNIYLEMQNVALGVRFGIYTGGGGRVHARYSGGWLDYGPLVNIGDELSFEYDTTTHTASFAVNGIRFASIIQRVYWPLTLTWTGETALSNIMVDAGATAQQRLVVYGTNLTQQSTTSDVPASMATVNGVACRSMFVTNGHFSCYVPSGAYQVGTPLNITFSTPHGRGATSLVTLQPHVVSVNRLVGGNTGGLGVVVVGGPWNASNSAVSICAADSLTAGAAGSQSLRCTTRAFDGAETNDTVRLTTNGATSFSTNSTSLWVAYPSARIDDIVFNITEGPVLTSASLQGDVMTLVGTHLPLDAAVVLSVGTCAVAQINTTHVECSITGVAPGTHNVYVMSSTIGTSASIAFSVALSLMSATPTTVGAGGYAELHIQGSGFGADGDGLVATLTVESVAICARIYRFDSVLVCVTKPGEFSGNVNVSLGTSATEMPWSALSTFTIQADSGAAVPVVTAVTPLSGLGATSLTIAGTLLNTATAVMLGEQLTCAIATQTDAQITCTLDAGFPAGRFPVHVVNSALGASVANVTYVGLLDMTTVRPGQGPKIGGQLVTIYGTGFSKAQHEVFLGASKCTIANVIADHLTCYSTPLVDAFTSNFDVSILVKDSSETATEASATYAYTAALTATVTSVSPTQTSAAGMELLTIDGSGFGTDIAKVSVWIGSGACRVESVTDATIQCRTSPMNPMNSAPVSVIIDGEGAAHATATVDVSLAITSIVGASTFSLEGGAVVTFAGAGFWTFSAGAWQSTYFNITLDGWLDCPIVESTWGTVTCRLPPTPRPQTTSPEMSASYVLRPNATLSVALFGNAISATVPSNVRIVYHADATPRITAVAVSSTTTTAYTGSVITITGSGFASTGNVVAVNGASCAPTSQSATTIQCVMSAGNFGPGFVTVFVPGVGFASTTRACSEGFLNCDGKCLTDPMCRYDAWGTTTCAELFTITAADTFCHANGGTDSTDKPFLTDSNTKFNLNCPMYSCEGKDCNTTLSIGGKGAVVSTCGADPNGFLVDFRGTVTAVAGGPASSVAGGLRITISGIGLPTTARATVLFGGVNCAVLSASTGNEIVCETGASASEGTDLPLAVYGDGYLSKCDGTTCTGFSYNSSITPTISSSTYAAAMQPVLTINGLQLPTSTTGVTLTFGGAACSIQNISATQIVCWPTKALAAGPTSISLHVEGVGLAAGNLIVTVPLTVISYSPTSGSLSGGTEVTLYGIGVTNTSTLTIGGCAATFVSLNATAGMLVVTTTACSSSTSHVVTLRTGPYTANAATRFQQTSAFTPTVSGSVSNNFFSLTLSNVGSASAGDLAMYVDKLTANCIINAFSLPTVTCTMESGYAAGDFNLTVYVKPFGFATHTVSGLFATYALSVSAASVTSGYRGGYQSLVLSGSGFGTVASSVLVTIDGVPCTVSSAANTAVTCTTGAAATPGTFPIAVAVRPTNAVGFASNASFSSFEYLSASPTVTSVYPTRGSTAGGTRLTIAGSSLASSFSVRVAGQACTMSSTEIAATDASNGTLLYCTTAAYQPMFSPEAIRVTPDTGLGDAFHDGTVDYQYIDLWSRWTTWGNAPPPQFGDSAVVSEGDVVMVDYSPPRFHLIVVMGTMLFDDTTDIFLECTYIMINYGRFIVGTPEKPFTKQATIRLWGDRLTPEIPVHGSKVLALRHGALDMHGIPRYPTWTRVTATASRGTSVIFVRGPVDWKAGEFIVVAPTDFDPMEGEVRMITSVVDGTSDNVTLVLEAPLDYTHFGQRQCFGADLSLCVDEIAEVGLLTRNVVVEGEPNSMNLGFGGTMFLMPLGQDKDRYARLSYIEVRKAGQQFIVGRYPVHYHVTGDVSNSYVNGTSVHDSLNRAFSIHGTSNNTYVNNVAYNVAGHAFFIEDGSERYNIIRNNFVVQVLATTSNLNTDITPAAIWVTAPMNFIDNNAVCGSQTFGIWFMPFDPYSTGPTYSTSICPFRQALGSCDNNVAHSNLWHGFHVFKFWMPLVEECNANSAIAPAYIRNMVVYKNQIWGAAVGNLEIGLIGAVIMDNLTSADNGFENADGASYWIEHISAPNQTCGLQNSLLIARTNNNPHTRWSSRRGVNLPQEDNFFVENVTFVNFDNENYGFEPQAWANFRSLCFPYGWEAVTRGLKWVDSPNRVLFRFPHHGIINDDDGTLSGVVGSQVVPNSSINLGASCTTFNYSPVFKGITCPNDYKIRRFGVSSSNNPQLDQIWRVEGRTELNYAIDRSYVFTAPINREINITFQTIATPTWWWQFGGLTFMQPNEKALFVTKYLQAPYRVYTRFDSKSTNTTYWGAFPTLADSKSGYAFDNVTMRLAALLVRPDTRLTASSSQCPPWGCAVEEVTNVWSKKCHHISDATGWSTGSAPSGTVDATVPGTTHFCLGYNASAVSSAHRTMEAQAVPRTCTAANQVTTYTFSSLTIFGAISMTNDACPCQGGTIVINIVKYIYIVGGGFILGNETHPITDCKVEVNILNAPWDAANLASYKNTFYGYRAFTFESGLLALHGAKPEPIFTRLASTAAAGTRTLVLESAVQWAVGDAVAIAGTSRTSKYVKRPARTDESEYNYISAISADKRTITLQNALAFRHYGAAPQTLNGKTYRVGAEVAVLSRRITFGGDTALAAYPQYGAGWKMNIGCTPGNKDGCVTARTMNSVNWGLAQVEGVAFRDIGQASFDDGAINIDGLTDGNGAINSYFRFNAFWKAFNTPFYIRDSTTGLELFGNVVYDIWGDGIRVESAGNNITSNLVMRMANSDPLCEPEAYNIFWSCRPGMLRVHAGNVVRNNIAASGIGAGFVTEGDFCTSNDAWSGNVAHSMRDGILVADSPAEGSWKWGSYASPRSCRRISGVVTYWSADHGIAAWSVLGNVTVQNYVSVDDQIGTFVMTLQAGQFQNYIPQVNYFNVTYANRWNNNDFACRSNYLAVPLPCRGTTLNSKFWCDFFTSTTSDKKVGNVGAMETIFASTALGIGLTHGEHKNMWEELDQYSTVAGQANYRDVHFANYDGMTSCGYRNLAFFQSHLSNDTFHQHNFERITWSNVAADGKVFMWRTYGEVTAMPTDIRTKTYWLDFNNYIHGAYWPDSPNKQLLNDVDGSFTQTTGRKSILASETLTRTSTFADIGYNGLAFTGGKLQTARDGCTFNVNMNAYICDQRYNWLALNLDSLADDQLTRRAGPVVICKGDGMVAANGDPNCPGGSVDFASGPVMKGKAQRSTLDRLSRWRLWAEDAGNYTLAFRGSPPAWLRIQLQDYEYLNRGLNVGLTINLRYSGANANSRVGVYVDGKRQVSNIGYTNPWQMSPVQQWPNSTARAGTHFMNLYTDGNVLNANGNIGYKKNVLYLTVRPGVVIDLIQEPIVQVNMQVSMTVDQFFEKKDTFVAALAQVLGIDASRIKITDVVAGTTRRRSGDSVNVKFEIEQDPDALSTDGAGTGGSTPKQSADLANIVSKLDVLATNTSVIAEAAGDTSFVVSGVTAEQVTVIETRPAISVTSGTPYLSFNASNPTNSMIFNATEVASMVSTWIETNFSATGAPYNTTTADGAIAVGNVWTNTTVNITQFTIIFSYDNNTHGYAALVNLNDQFLRDATDILPGYTVHGIQFLSNNYVADVPTPAPGPSSPTVATDPENITKFAIGIGIGVAIVMVIGGAGLYHFLIVQPKLKLKKMAEEKAKLRDIIDANTNRKPVQQHNNLVGGDGTSVQCFPRADNLESMTA